MDTVTESLVDSGKIDQRIIDDAIQLTQYSDIAPWELLVQNGHITEEEVFRLLAEHRSLEYVDVSDIQVPQHILDLLPSDFCQKHKVLPIALYEQDSDDKNSSEKYVFIATSSPDDIEVLDDVLSITNYRPAPVISAPLVLNNTINRSLRSDRELSDLSQQISEEAFTVQQEVSQTVAIEESTDESAPNVRFVNLLISQAIKDRASDIHVEPTETHLNVRFRIDGVLQETQQASKNIQSGVISRLKIMSSIDIAEKRKPQDGRFSMNYNGQKVDVRVASLPTVWGEKIVMRILDSSTTRMSLDYLEMSEANARMFREAINSPHGLILVTGPTGSGKSTTLYTTLDEVANSSVNVITVEDPVEKRIPGVNQMQINNKAGLTFPTALRSILRSDPDIVLVGEIRDSETATIAVEASLTGHLVLSTLHTNSAPAALPRLTEMGVEPYLVASSISLVVAQRLARRLCERCKTLKDIDPSVLREVGFPQNEDNEYPEVLYAPVGCSLCANTGYRGRVPLIEIMKINEEIEKRSIEGATVSEITQIAKRNGFVSLKEDGWRRIQDGLTTIEEVLRVSA